MQNNCLITQLTAKIFHLQLRRKGKFQDVSIREVISSESLGLERRKVSFFFGFFLLINFKTPCNEKNINK